ncbi:von Willebrand factor [Anomaloglossus baeobatrachus]|uniref:von Willebrand factor n=1 Tax=Anomaloglossus baeobatrachus TaxID=238106 RepID=UPI003F5027BA
MHSLPFTVLLACLIPQGKSLDVFGKPDFSSLSRCSLFGKNHIRTFDGTFYDFLGDCSYMLAGDCHKHSFSLLVDYRQGKKNSVSMYLGEYYDIHVFLDGTATEGEKTITMPYAANGIYLENEAGYYKLSSEEHGIMVKIDVSGNVQVILSNEHFNRTCGLCGNFNQFAEDDFMTQEGILAEKSYEFANSWALHGGEKRCKRIYPPSNTCNISSDAAEKDFMQRCQYLKTSPVFEKCHQAVNPDPFIAICENDMCDCAEDVNCPCHTFLEYARTCAQQGVIVSSWPIHTTCKPQCPHGMVYNECVSPCVKSCQSLDINEVCQEQCTDGCSCPEGKVLDGSRCVAPAECSCIHSGNRYPVGSTIKRDCNTCSCKSGLWECSNEDCPGECYVTGQSHFKSFDNKHFTFSGICHYLLAKDMVDGAFSVAIETVQCADDPDAVCTRSATVRLLDMHNMTLKFKHGGGVSIDGQDIMLPLLHGYLRIQTTALFSVRLSYREDLQIDWDGHGKLIIKLSPVFAESTSGLCGNYNGNQGDDFLTPSGLVETNVEDFGNSWKLNGDCADLVKQDTDPCSLNPRQARYAEEVCSTLMEYTFQPCHSEVNPLPYLKNCRYDVCSCSNGKECMCSAISTYAMACSRKGVLIEWRSPEFCSIRCSEGKIYQQCGSPCNQTCRSLSQPDTNCRELCMEGCYCPPGLYTNEYGECVHKSECSCYYDGELFQPDDVFSDHHSMCYCENGLMHCTMNDLPGNYYAEAFFSQSARVKRSADCRPPMEKVVCSPDDPTIKGIECAKTCANYDWECMGMKCISGCMCPSGMVRHNNRCIFPHKCPCRHAGKDYAPGETVIQDCNTCVCRDRTWECTKNVCPSTCSAIGVSHYFTFDGMVYNFPGDCQYVLAQDFCGGEPGSFRILVGNVGCGFTGDRCSKRITILFRNGEIELENEQVYIRKPLSSEIGFDIQQSGNYFILTLGSEISVTWDKGKRVYVTLKGTLRNKVCGLCGNFDGIENNDLMSSNNQVENNPSNFGNSWKVKPFCADVAIIATIANMPLCQGNALKQAAVENACDILWDDIFKDCHKVVDPVHYHDICTHDTCICESIGDCACFCDSVAAYTHACAQEGVHIQWRSSHFCPQSCEEKNVKELDYVCEWRYNSCAPACPVTCQHPEHTNCPLKCVEGCHAHCPPGKILNEETGSCIDVQDCPVCVVEGRRIPHGKHILLNQDDPALCQECHCEEQRLQCSTCTVHTTSPPTRSPEIPPGEPTPEPTPFEEEYEGTVAPGTYNCEKAMDLVFLVDGSSKLPKTSFETVKDFIVSIMEKIRISQKRIRVSVVQYNSTHTPKLFSLNERRKLSDMVAKVRNMKYMGSPTSSAAEGIKFTNSYVFDLAKRDNAPRMILLITASKSSKSLSFIRGIKKRKITLIPIGIGPYVDMGDIEFIKMQSPMNKPFLVPNVEDLMARKDEIIDYLCDLVPEPTRRSIAPSKIPTEPPVDITTTTAEPSRQTPMMTTPGHVPVIPDRELTIAFEGSMSIEKIKIFLEDLIQRMDIGEETIHITIIQYSFTVTVEYTFTGRLRKQEIIRQIRQIEHRGGNATNTGEALRYISQHTSKKYIPSSHPSPHLVYMIQENPPTDVIRKEENINVFPISVGPKAPIRELDIFGHQKVFESYDQLSSITEEILTGCCTRIDQPTHIPIVPCIKQMDVIFMLDSGLNVKESEFENMKTFVKNFIKKAHIGHEATQVAVLQYGWAPNMEVAWTDPQEKISLIKAVDNIQKIGEGSSRIGDALNFAVQSAVSDLHGARPLSSKIAIDIVADKSSDQVDYAATFATANLVSVFPIGVGSRYEDDELVTLAGPSGNHKITKVQLFDDLPTMLLLRDDFINKLCIDYIKVCIDEGGNPRKTGDTWMLQDSCHKVTCLEGGITKLSNIGVDCTKIPQPMCDNDLPAIKIKERCGCRWVCPCICKGSSSRHIVTFDGLNFKLLGNCSYVLFNDPKNNLEVVLQNGECVSSNGQTCMDSVTMKYNGDTAKLSYNMQVSVNGEQVQVPYNNTFEVAVFGAIMHNIKIPELGFVFTFTPTNNEFILEFIPHGFSAKTSGLCGICDHNPVNDFILKDGSVTRDKSRFVKEWTLVDEFGRTCETKLDDVCRQSPSHQCNILLSETFEQCHSKIQPSDYFKLCQETSCHGQDPCEIIASYSHLCHLHGVCVNWRSSEVCPMVCPNTMAYNHCHTGCEKDCNNTHIKTMCFDHPTEGCFCPSGEVMFNGKCVSESVCDQCTDDNGDHHKHLETWIPFHDPCSICICLDDRITNCSVKPCPTAKPSACGACEIPSLKQRSDRCCPEYECVCDESSCEIPPVPHCENGMELVLTNPGECKPVYECACRRETCPLLRRPSCPPYKRLTKMTTECCDTYECKCSCFNSTDTCPSGYTSSIHINDCGCTSVTCDADKVCVHKNNIYHVGSSWEDGCLSCQCTNAADPITNLLSVTCEKKPCKENCLSGFKYVTKEHECCGTCKRAVCEQELISRRRGDVEGSDTDKRYYSVGARWTFPYDPCIINECAEVNGEVFTLQRNISCSDIETKKCPTGYELSCTHGSECCPICQCEPIPGCLHNGTIIGPGKTLLIDECSNCKCSVSSGPIPGYKLSCRHIRCESCPENTVQQKTDGSCCGKCVLIACPVTMNNGNRVTVEPNETLRDGCNTHICRANEQGDLMLVTNKITCLDFNREKCLADGGKIKQLDDSCCETCVEPECKQAGVPEYIHVDDCVSERELSIVSCKGKCTSTSIYNTKTRSMEDQCTCCSATQTELVNVSLRCTNGTTVEHKVTQATNCECLSRQCEK